MSLSRDYSAIVEQMTRRYGLIIRRWRKAMSGCAYRVHHEDGTIDCYVESPEPRTPLTLSIFLHEVGHHAIGFDRYRTRCEEEYHVWVWAIEQMRSLGVEPDKWVTRRFELSIQYAVDKALRRGLKQLPGELERFAPKRAA